MQLPARQPSIVPDEQELLLVVEWFRQSLVFVRQSSLRPRRDERLARFVERSELNKIKFLDLARVADMGISDIAVEYGDDPRAAEETEMLQFILDQLEIQVTREGDKRRGDLAKET